MSMYNNYGYNPVQSRMDSLMQQKAMIEGQIQSLNQMAMPPININNNIPQQSNTSNFDFNGKWVENEEQAKQVSNNNLPLILFDNNSPMFYMKNLDGSFKKFKFEEVADNVKNDDITNKRMDTLESKLDALINTLSSPQQQEQQINDRQQNKQGGKK